MRVVTALVCLRAQTSSNTTGPFVSIFSVFAPQRTMFLDVEPHGKESIELARYNPAPPSVPSFL